MFACNVQDPESNPQHCPKQASVKEDVRVFVGGVIPRGGGNRKVIHAPGIPGGERIGADKSNHI